MPRPAPAAKRALLILDFLAAHPLEEYTLTELAREIGMNVASTHAVLAVMTDSGFLVRHPSHKTYRLGPATMAIGHAALQRYPVLDLAREEMRKLAEDYSAECRAAAPIGQDLVMVARVGRPNPERPLAQVGERLPLVPPLGLTVIAWSSTAEIRDWLERADKTDERFDEPGLLRLLESVRVLNFTVGLATDSGTVPATPVPDNPFELQLDRDRRHAVKHIASPIFDHEGRVALVLSLEAFSSSMSADEINDCGRRLRSAALIVSRLAGGTVPSMLSRTE
jgi:DNA-binding IclR family transcriptional regulator